MEYKDIIKSKDLDPNDFSDKFKPIWFFWQKIILFFLLIFSFLLFLISYNGSNINLDKYGDLIMFAVTAFFYLLTYLILKCPNCHNSLAYNFGIFTGIFTIILYKCPHCRVILFKRSPQWIDRTKLFLKIMLTIFILMAIFVLLKL